MLRLAALLRRMLAAALLRRMLACLLALTLGVGVGQTIDATPVVGHCGPTSPGECGGSRESGSWHTRRERIRSLEQCAERCRACPSCSFVSYSKVKAASPHVAARTLTSTAWRCNPHPAPPQSQVLTLTLTLTVEQPHPSPHPAQQSRDCSWYRRCDVPGQLAWGGTRPNPNP